TTRWLVQSRCESVEAVPQRLTPTAMRSPIGFFFGSASIGAGLTRRSDIASAQFRAHLYPFQSMSDVWCVTSATSRGHMPFFGFRIFAGADQSLFARRLLSAIHPVIR